MKVLEDRISDPQGWKDYSLVLQQLLTSGGEVPSHFSTGLRIGPDIDDSSEDKSVWIIKPVGLSCGERIEVSQGMRQTLEIAQSFSFKCIVQKYIERPLLVRQSRKFDICQWILITSLQPLTVYGFSECYLRLTSKLFTLNEESLSDPLSHLCNHAIQKVAASDQRGRKKGMSSVIR